MHVMFLVNNNFVVSFQQAVWPHSGHYRPTEENFKEFIAFLQENKVSLSDVKVFKTSKIQALHYLLWF